MTQAIFLLENIDKALELAKQENLKDEDHPSFYLYDAHENGKCKLVAELVRDFGHSELYFKPLLYHYPQ